VYPNIIPFFDVQDHTYIYGNLNSPIALYFGDKTFFSHFKRPPLNLEKELNAKKANLETLLKESDFISLHVPLIPATHHLIGEKELKMMKKTAVLINTSRGPVVDEKALAKALKEKWIFGAGLDVYENEPEITKELINLDNIVLQPHSASATTESRTDMAIMAAENMIAGLKGEIPPNCVNPEVFK